MNVKAKVSTSLEDLVKQLANSIQILEGNVFSPVYILTPNNGIDKWLKLRIADTNGICANVSFLSFSELLEALYYGLVPKENRKEKLSPSQFQWLIYSLLGDETFLEDNLIIKNYFQTDEDITSIKRYGLSGKIARVLEQYSALLPDKLEEWENLNNLDSLVGHEKWQADLWKSLKVKYNFLIQDLDVFIEISKQLDTAEVVKKVSEFLPRLFAFNYYDFTPAQLSVIVTLSKHIPVELFFFSALDNEKEQKIVHPLLKNWAGNQRLLFKELSEAKIAVEYLPSSAANTNTLLWSFQDDLRNNRIIARNMDPSDGSIVVNSCFTIYREVEVLYNYLVRTIEKNNEIGSRDIVVYCSDIHQYAPAINAIFENAPYKIPFNIVDSDEKDVSSPLMALLSLFEVDPDRLPPEAVMHLLEFPAIRRKFSIEDTSLIRRLINTANIRHGYEGEREIETNLISWRHGLDKLLLSFYMSGEGLHDFEADGYGSGEYYLLDAIEGSAVFEIVRFRYLIESLHHFLKETKTQKTLSAWIDYLRETVTFFVDVSGDNRLRIFDKELAKLSVVAEGNNETIPFPVIRKTLDSLIDKINEDKAPNDKGITFCSSLPTRSVPFKVVALLGVNYHDFPRRNTSLSFDFTNDLPAAQGRKHLEKDKLFFLEAILSARQQLYISYIGRNAKTGAKLPPSSLVDELLDYIENTYGVEKNTFPIKHPLYTFNPKYNGNDQRFYNYLGKTNANPLPKADVPGPNVIQQVREVTLENFLSYFKDPFKYYFNHVLGIYYRDDDNSLHEEEIFELNTLDSWKLKSGVMDNSITFQDRKTIVEKGLLPLHNLGKAYLDKESKDIGDLQDIFKQQTNGWLKEERPIQLQFGNILIKGICNNLYKQDNIYKMVVYSISSKTERDKLIAMANYMLVRHCLKDIKFSLVFLDRNGIPSVLGSDVIDGELFDENFNKLLKMFAVAQNKLIAFDVMKVEEDDYNEYVKTLQKKGQFDNQELRATMDEYTNWLSSNIINFLEKIK